ncbi:hypothetical protein CCHR01_12033 [Colletotrichum chrysophilum]|uniref:Uncharacterized protein n=1 Tax=Colletotrichum chrysophilum TaxID=1836956 RepID=A0AAD9EHU6_9PEZI|nr:hypothetical protein CCHR01_12033 [Colletotrichum chrysophilum]
MPEQRNASFGTRGMAVDRKAAATIRLCRHTVIQLSHPFCEVYEKCRSRAAESKCTCFSRSTHFRFICHAILPCSEEQLLKHLNAITPNILFHDHLK